MLSIPTTRSFKLNFVAVHGMAEIVQSKRCKKIYIMLAMHFLTAAFVGFDWKVHESPRFNL